MKGYTKGKGKGKKFIPTSNDKGSLRAVSKEDIHREAGVNIPSSIGNQDLIRKKQSLDQKSKKEIKITGIRFNMAENFDIKYNVDGEGEVTYEGGLQEALRQMGARKLTTREIGVLIDKDEETDVTSQAFFKDNREASDDYRIENTNDNTINYGSLFSEMTDYGFFKVNGIDLLAVTSHANDDTDGIYDIGYIDDVEGIGEESNKFYVGGLLDPRLDIEFTVSGKKFRIEKNNGSSGYDSLEDEDDSGFNQSEILGEYNGNLEDAIGKFKNRRNYS